MFDRKGYQKTLVALVSVERPASLSAKGPIGQLLHLTSDLANMQLYNVISRPTGFATGKKAKTFADVV